MTDSYILIIFLVGVACGAAVTERFARASQGDDWKDRVFTVWTSQRGWVWKWEDKA